MITNWKRSIFSCLAAMAVLTFMPLRVDAQHHHHGGGHHGGGHYGGGHYGGHHHHSLGHLHLGYGGYGYGGYGGYGNYGYYPTYGNGYYSSGTTYYTPPVVVQNVVPSNVVPYAMPVGVASYTGTIQIVNPSDSGGEVSYTLNGNPYSIKPGHAQTIQNDRLWTVAFGSGGAAGDVRYSLQPGTYKFKVSDTGWNLFKSQEQTNVASQPLPPAPEPLNDEPRSVRIPIPQP